jgi:hypothetical protein
MSEATEFLGVVQPALPGETRPLPFRRKTPEAGVVEYFPVFTSREGAEAFVRAAGYPDAYDVAIGSRGEELRTESLPLTEMLRNIRPLGPGEIPSDHKVALDPIHGEPADFVTWGELLSGRVNGPPNS